MSEAKLIPPGIYTITNVAHTRPVGRSEYVQGEYPAPFPPVVAFPQGTAPQKWEIEPVPGKYGLYHLIVLPGYGGHEKGLATDIAGKVYAVPIIGEEAYQTSKTEWRIVESIEGHGQHIYNIYEDSPIRPTPGWVAPEGYTDKSQIIIRPIELGNLPDEQFIIVPS